MSIYRERLLEEQKVGWPKMRELASRGNPWATLCYQRSALGEALRTLEAWRV